MELSVSVMGHTEIISLDEKYARYTGSVAGVFQLMRPSI
jgi:hypothetical protein